MRAPAPSPWVAVAEAAGSARVRAGAQKRKDSALPKRRRAELRLAVPKPDRAELRLAVQKPGRAELRLAVPKPVSTQLRFDVPKRTRISLQLDVQKRVRAWTPRRADLTAWASAALGRRATDAELSVRLVGRAEGRKLNAQYRGKDYATNVLSFPASPAATPPGAALEPTHLGDLVICPPVLRAEALEQRKTLRAHWAHLVVHGLLHLMGYDHERDDDARRMERREIAVLRRLGFANPYLSTS